MSISVMKFGNNATENKDCFYELPRLHASNQPIITTATTGADSKQVSWLCTGKSLGICCKPFAIIQPLTAIIKFPCNHQLSLVLFSQKCHVHFIQFLPKPAPKHHTKKTQTPQGRASALRPPKSSPDTPMPNPRGSSRVPWNVVFPKKNIPWRMTYIKSHHKKYHKKQL